MGRLSARTATTRQKTPLKNRMAMSAWRSYEATAKKDAIKTPAIGALLVQCARGSSVMIGSGECYDLAQAVIRWSTCATSRAGRYGRRCLSKLGRHTGSNERPRIRRCGTNAGPGTARPLVLGKGKQRSANTTDSRYPFVINISGDVLNLGSAIGPPMWRRQQCSQKVDSSLTPARL
jgi:hypothetical protein